MSVGNRREVHVQPFPAGAGHWQISNAGGDWPRWRKDGKELFYHSLGPVNAPESTRAVVFVGPLSSVAVTAAGTSFEHAAPAPVLNIRAINLPHGGADYHTYAVSPDGQRFLYFQSVPAGAAAAGADQITPDHPNGLMIAINWAAALKK